MEFHRRLFGVDKLVPKSLIEISGPSNSGKTLLVQQLMAHYISDLNWEILFLNLSHKVQIHNFAKIITEKASTSRNENLEKRLNSVKLINCFSPKELDESLEIIKYMLLGNRNIKLIVIDTLSEFFWLDMEQRTMKISKLKYYVKYVQSLEAICREVNVCGMWTVDNKFVSQMHNGRNDPIQIDHRLRFSIIPQGGIQLNGQSVELTSQGVKFVDEA
ncbi:DNA repair protein XRCC2 [Drosophila tropicalis]|uniref:DNA repair protein XRCC2 n=1 Tax=Drosophila tropicalis TaxID=46794 RepID=UPI0035AC101B